MVNIVITYSEAVDNAPMQRCRMLSAFEGREAKGGDGNSLFTSVVITDGDEQVMRAYFAEGAHLVEGMVRSRLDEDGTDINDEEASYNFINSMASKSKLCFSNGVKEALAAYGMHRWLADKLPQRSDAYKQMWLDLVHTAVKVVLVKQRPKMPS